MRRFEVLYDWCLGGCMPIYDAPKGSKQWRPHWSVWEMVPPQPEWTVGPQLSYGPRAVLGWCDNMMKPSEALKYVRQAASKLPDVEEALLIVSIRPDGGKNWRVSDFRVGLLFVPEAKKDWFPPRSGDGDRPTNFPQRFLYF